MPRRTLTPKLRLRIAGHSRASLIHVSPLAVAIALASPTPASAQSAMQASFAPDGPATIGSALDPMTGATTDTVTVNADSVVINWTPNDQNAGSTPIIILGEKDQLVFKRDGVSDYTVLNRIIPVGLAKGRAIQFDGSIVSLVNNLPGQGNVWFYSPDGVIVGRTGIINVGSLVLTTLDHPYDSATGTLNFGVGGAFRFGADSAQSSAAKGGSFVRVEPGAKLNALAAGSYLALISPRVEQEGELRTSGSAALVAASQMNMLVTVDGLYDIAITSGSDDSRGIVHTGTTGGPARTPANPGTIFMAAVPKSDVMTMLLGGSIGYDAAGATVLGNGNIVLTSGYDITAGSASGPSSGSFLEANMAIGSPTPGAPATFTSAVFATARDNLALAATPATIRFAENAQFDAGREVSVVADGLNTVIAKGDLSITSGAATTIGHSAPDKTVPTLAARNLSIDAGLNVLATPGTAIHADLDVDIIARQGRIVLDTARAGDDLRLTANDTVAGSGVIEVGLADAFNSGLSSDGDGSNVFMSASDSIAVGDVHAVNDARLLVSGTNINGVGTFTGAGAITAGSKASIYALNGITGTAQVIASTVELGGSGIQLDLLASQTELSTIDSSGAVTDVGLLRAPGNVSIGTLRVANAGGTLLDATVEADSILIGTADANDITLTGNSFVKLDNTVAANTVTISGGTVESGGTIAAQTVGITGSSITFGAITPIAGQLAANGGPVTISSTLGSITGGSISTLAATNGVISLNSADAIDVGDLDGQWLEVQGVGLITTGILKNYSSTPNYVRSTIGIDIADTDLTSDLELTAYEGSITANKLSSDVGYNINAAGLVTIGSQSAGQVTAVGNAIFGTGPLVGTGHQSYTSFGGDIVFNTLDVGSLTVDSAAAIGYQRIDSVGDVSLTSALGTNGGAITSPTGSITLTAGANSSLGAVFANNALDIEVVGDLAFDDLDAGQTTSVRAYDLLGNTGFVPDGGRIRGGSGLTVDASSFTGGALDASTGPVAVTLSASLVGTTISSSTDDVTLAVGGTINAGAISGGDDLRISSAAITAGELTVTGNNGDNEGDGHNILVSAPGVVSVGDVNAAQIAGLQQGNVDIRSFGSSVSTGAINAQNDLTLRAVTAIDTGDLKAGDDLTVVSGGAGTFGDVRNDGTGLDTEGDGANLVVNTASALSAGTVTSLTGSASLTSLSGTGGITATTVSTKNNFTASAAGRIAMGNVAADGDATITAGTSISLGDTAGVVVALAAQTGLTGGAITGTQSVSLANSSGTIATGPIVTGSSFLLNTASQLALGGVTVNGVPGPNAPNAIVVSSSFAGTSSTGDLTTTGPAALIDVSAPILVTGSTSAGSTTTLRSTVGGLTTGNVTGPDAITLTAATTLTSGAVNSGAGDVSLNATGAIVTGDLAALAGSLTLANLDAPITTGMIALSNDFTLSTNSVVDLGGVTAGDDIVITVGSNSRFGTLLANGGGTDNESDGANIRLTSTGTMFVDHTEADKNFTATATRFETGPDTIITGGDIVLNIAGDILLGNSQAGGLIDAKATAGSVSFGTIGAGNKISMSATGTITGTGATSGLDFDAVSDNGVDIGTIASGRDLFVGITAISATGDVRVGSATAARSLAIANFGNGNLIAGTLASDATINAATIVGDITVGSAIARGTVLVPAVSGSGQFVDSIAVSALPKPSGDVLLSAGGTATLDNANAARMIGLRGAGVASSGTLTAGSDVRVVSGGGAALNIVEVGDDLDVSAAGPLTLASATTTGTGPDTTALLDTTSLSFPYFAFGADTAPAGSGILLRTTGGSGTMTLGTLDAANGIDAVASATMNFASLKAGGPVAAGSFTAIVGGTTQAGTSAQIATLGTLDLGAIGAGTFVVAEGDGATNISGPVVAGTTVRLVGTGLVTQDVTGGGDVELIGSGGLSAGAVTSTGGLLTLTGTSGIVTGNLSAAAGGVTLANPAGTIATGLITSRDAFTLSTPSALDLGGVTTTIGAIDISSSAAATLGNLSSAGAITVSAANLAASDAVATGTLALTTTAGPLAAGALTGSDVNATSTGTLTTGNILATPGSVALTAAGALTTGNITAGSGSVSLANTAGAITTGTILVANDFDLNTANPVSLAGVTAGDDITVAVANDANLGTLIANASGTDNEPDGSNIRVSATGNLALAVATAANDISVSAGQTGGSQALTVGSLTAGRDIALANLAGGGTTTTIALNAANRLSFATPGTVTVNGTANALNASFNMGTSGILNVPGTITVGQDLIVSDAARFTLDTSPVIGGSFTVSNSGTVTFNAPVSAPRFVNLDGATVQANGTLAAGLDLVIGGNTGTFNAARDVTAGQRLLLTSGATASTFAGNVAVGGSSPLSAMIARTGSLRVLGTTNVTGYVDIVASGPVTLGALSATRYILVTSGGAFSATGPLTGTDLNANANSITLSSANVGSNLALTSATSLLTGNLTTTGGDMALNAGTTITTGDLSARNGSIGLTNGIGQILTGVITAANDFTINSASDLNFAGISIGDDIRIATSGNATVGTLTSTGLGTDSEGDGNTIRLNIGGNLALTSATTPGNVSATAGGSLALGTVSSGGTISGQSGSALTYSGLTAGTGATLTSASTLSGGNISTMTGSISASAASGLTTGNLNAAGGGVSLSNGAGTITTGLIASRDTLSLITPSALDLGGVTSATGGILIDTNAAATFGALAAPGPISVKAASITGAGMTAGGALTLASTSGAISTGALSGASVDADSATTLTSGNVTATNGNLTLRAVQSLTSGDLSALNGSIGLANTLGPVATGTILASDDFTLATDGDVNFAGITVGDDIRLTTNGAMTLGTVKATGAGRDNESDGSNIVLTAGRALDVGHAEAARNFVARAASFKTGLNTIITGGDIDLVTTGASSLGNSQAGGFLRVNAGGSIDFASILAGSFIDLTAGTTIAGTSARSGADFTANSGGAIDIASLDVGGNLLAAAKAGPIILPRVIAAGTITASGTAVTMAGPGTLNIASAVASSGGIDIAAGNRLTVANAAALAGAIRLAGSTVALNSSVDAAQAIDVTANNGGISVAGSVLGDTIALGSADIAIASSGRVGALPRTRQVTLVNTGVTGSTGTTIGGAGTSSGYTLSDAEAQRVFGNSITISAPRVSTAPVLTRAPDVVIDSLNLSGTIGANGTYRIETPGKISVVGAVRFGGLANTNLIDLVGQDMIAVDPATGSIVLSGSGGALAGKLALSSDRIIAASPQALTDIAAAPTLSAISARLSTNDGARNDQGVFAADSITATVGSAFYVQNTGITPPNQFVGFGERRGITVGAGGLRIVPTATTTRVAINGRQLSTTATGGFTTGLSFIPLVQIGSGSAATGPTATGALDTDSTINGCGLTRVTQCQVGFDQPNPAREIVVGQDEQIKAGRITPVVLIQLRGREDQTSRPMVDDPVTGAGNDDLWGTFGTPTAGQDGDQANAEDERKKGRPGQKMASGSPD